MSKTVTPPDRPSAEAHVRIFRPSNRHYNSIRIENGPNEYLECWGYRASFWKWILYHVLGILSCGIGYVILSWFPTWLASLKLGRCSISQADTILLKDQHKQYHICYVQRQVATETAKALCPELKNNAFPDSDVSDRVKLEKLKFAKNGHVKDTAWVFRYFDFRYSRYVWVQAEDTFKLLTGLVPGITCSDLSSRNCGISDEHRQQKLRLYGQNLIEISTPPILKLLIEEVLNPFYCFQIFCIVLWSLDNYYIYATCVLLISVVGISLSLYETRKQRLRLRDMVRKSSTNSKVLLMKDNGEYVECLPENVVPGDIICIPVQGCVMSCDAVLIEGNAIVNEAVLTGESAPVTKIALNVGDTDKFSVDEHKRHILFHGTTVIQTRYYEGAHVRAVVLETGFYTVKGDLFKSILYPKPIDFKFHRDALRLIGCMAFISCCGMCYSIYIYNDHGEDVWKIILRALDLMTIVVPPALPAALTVGIVYSQRRLKQAKIFCIQPSRINACGKIKLVCFDKTGTLTEEGLDLMGVIAVEDGHLGRMVDDMKQLGSSHPLIAGMATCHSLTVVNGQLTGDPLDLKLFEATKWEMHEPQQSRQEGSAVFNSLIPTTVCPRRPNPEVTAEADSMLGHIGIVKQYPFSSGLQRMSVITRDLSQDCFTVFTKGSPEKMAALSKQETVPVNFHKTLHFYADQGYRVIALAWRQLDVKVSFHQMSRLKRDEVERDLTFLGLMVMRNSLKPSTHGVIRELKAADIRPVMVTGDNLLTAISVGRDCGMIQKEENIVTVEVMPPDERMSSAAHILWRLSNSALSASHFSLADDSLSLSPPSRAASANQFLMEMSRPRYHLALTGRSFSSLVEYFPELLPKVLVCGTIFARFSPEQKTELVEKLIELEYIVGMVGDGANDCGALKAAHVGISLSEAEASVASPFTSNRNTIECVPAVISEGRSALTTSFGVFKYMLLYSIVQFIALLILYQQYTILLDAHFLFVDLLITGAVSLLMGSTGASKKLVATRPHGSLMAPIVLLSLFIHMLVVIAFQTMIILTLHRQPWYVPVRDYDGPENHERVVSWESTVLFIAAAFQDLILAFVFSKGFPYRKPVYTNVMFLGALVGFSGLTAWLFLYPPLWLKDFLQIIYDPANPHLSFRLTILGLLALNFLVAFVLEEFMFDRVWFANVLRTIRRKKHSKSAFKLVERQLSHSLVDWPPVGQTTFSKSQDSLSSSSVEVGKNRRESTYL